MLEKYKKKKENKRMKINYYDYLLFIIMEKKASNSHMYRENLKKFIKIINFLFYFFM